MHSSSGKHSMDTMKSSNAEASNFSGKPSDTENMMASALLKFRSDAVGQAGNLPREAEGSFSAKVSSRPPKKKRNTISTSSTKTQPQPTDIQSQQIPPIAPASPTKLYATNQAHGRSRHLSTTPQQLAFLQEAAASGPTSFIAAPSNQALQGVAGQAFQIALVQAGLLSTRGVQQAPMLSPPPSGTWDSTSAARPDSSSSNSDKRQEAAVSPDTIIRYEKVEAALRSKPQRGRKRENLTETERLELTRTRNREHAKSTRIRKKQRYQELLDNEKKLQDYQSKEEINKKRRQCVVDFVAIREAMLRSASDPSSESPKSDATTQVDNTVPKGLEDVIEDLSDFSFKGGLGSFEEISAAARMHRFDDETAIKVKGCFGTAAMPLLSYKIKGSSDGIGFNLNDTGFAEIELVVSGQEEVDLVSGLMVFHFGENSDKLHSVQWRVTRDAVEEGSFERLDGQTSHPSVVSLDHDKTSAGRRTAVTKKTTEEEKHGPGMDI